MGLLNFRRKSKKQSSDYPSTFIQSEVEIPSLPVYNEKYLSLSSPTLSKSQTFSKVPDTSLMDDIMNELGSSKDASSKPMPSSTTNPKVIRPLLQFDTLLEETVKSATNNPAASFELESATGQQKPLLHFSSIKKPTFQHQENKKLELQQENHTNNLNNRDEHTGDADEEEEKEEKEDNYILGSRLMRNQVKRHSAPVNNKPSPMPLSSSSASDTSNEPVQPSSKTLMDRMKERHRQEARRSSSSPFMDRNLSSPSMPIIAGATTDRFSHIADGSKNRPQKNMVQSQSCNMFMKPSVTIKNENCSFDIFNAPIQTQSDVSLSNTRRFHSLQHSYHQPALSSLPIQENEEDIPSLPRFALNRSVSAYPGFPTRSLQQQQQILLQQQQQQQEQQQMQQQQIQQQIELKQHQLEEQQRLQQQKLQQLHLQQKQQQEQNNINQAILDSIMSSSLEYEAGKHHLTSKPLYKRLPVEKYRKHHHHHHHHHQQHRHHHCSYHSNDSCKSIALHRCRTPPPESHHLAIDESKNKKEVLERPLSPVSLTDKEKLASIEDIIMNSSSSTLASDPKIKVVDIPLKLKRELQDMQLRRSSYSVPDLSRFSKENIPEIDENKWNTLCPISNSENKTKEREDKIQEKPFCRKRHRCRSKCCHHRHCYSSIKPCSNTLKHSQSTCSVVSEVDDMTHCHYKKSLCRSARHCKHH